MNNIRAEIFFLVSNLTICSVFGMIGIVEENEILILLYTLFTIASCTHFLININDN